MDGILHWASAFLLGVLFSRDVRRILRRPVGWALDSIPQRLLPRAFRPSSTEGAE